MLGKGRFRDGEERSGERSVFYITHLGTLAQSTVKNTVRPSGKSFTTLLFDEIVLFLKCKKEEMKVKVEDGDQQIKNRVIRLSHLTRVAITSHCYPQ